MIANLSRMATSSLLGCLGRPQKTPIAPAGAGVNSGIMIEPVA
jgi:hypothetical protein